jgi:hypothetical protein
MTFFLRYDKLRLDTTFTMMTTSWLRNDFMRKKMVLKMPPESWKSLFLARPPLQRGKERL